LYGDKGKFCIACRKTADKLQKELDCDTCPDKQPDIDDDIRLLIRVFNLCDSQVRVAMSGVFALDWPTVIIVAQAHDIEINSDFFQYLRLFEQTYIAETTKKKPT